VATQSFDEIRLDSDSDGVVVVDHGSRLDESNRWIHLVAERLKQALQHQNVYPAHMELAEPSIQQAVDDCVGKGARRIVVIPFFLLPGRHWKHDIPQLSRNAVAKHRGVRCLVTAPLGLHDLMIELMQLRMKDCLRTAAATSDAKGCDVCVGDGCQWMSGGSTE
jgi:sirohydrochlorin ferrochelatase